MSQVLQKWGLFVSAGNSTIDVAEGLPEVAIGGQCHPRMKNVHPCGHCICKMRPSVIMNQPSSIKHQLLFLVKNRYQGIHQTVVRV